MPRPKRSFRPDTAYHLIPRFVGGQWFIRTGEERAEYLRLLGLGLEASDWKCFSFAIMSNHIHLGLVAGVTELVSWIRDVHGEFADWINRRSKRIGAVFVRGPKSYEMQPTGVARLIGYIHRNPVRAGLVDDPIQSDWTSHRAYAGRDQAPSWLASALGLELAGFGNAQQMHRWVCATAVDRYDLQAALANAPRRGAPRKPKREPPRSASVGQSRALRRLPSAGCIRGNDPRRPARGRSDRR